MLRSILEALTVEVVNNCSLPTFIVNSVAVVNNVPYPVPLEPTPILPGEKMELTILAYQTLETLHAKITVPLINDKHKKVAKTTSTAK